MDEYRFPFSPYPTGWYLLTESASLAPGDVVPIRYFGRDAVLFRTSQGEAAVLDAHCPHMGAHLGHGGTVEGECIRCPFHSWGFDTAGSCQDVPYKTTPGLPRVGLTRWPVHETSGLVLVHFSENGRPATWQMPDQPAWDADGWVGYETRRWTVRTHVQELMENIPDTTHFVSVHDVATVPEARVETNDHIYHQALTSAAAGGRTVLTQVAYGPGLAWLEVEEPVRYRMLVAGTPIDEHRIDLRLLFLVHEGAGTTELSAMGKTAVDLISMNTERDIRIWENKVYRDRPPLVAGDGPIGVLRKWARQFYETASPPSGI